MTDVAESVVASKEGGNKMDGNNKNKKSWLLLRSPLQSSSGPRRSVCHQLTRIIGLWDLNMAYIFLVLIVGTIFDTWTEYSPRIPSPAWSDPFSMVILGGRSSDFDLKDKFAYWMVLCTHITIMCLALVRTDASWRLLKAAWFDRVPVVRRIKYMKTWQNVTEFLIAADTVALIFGAHQLFHRFLLLLDILFRCGSYHVLRDHMAELVSLEAKESLKGVIIRRQPGSCDVVIGHNLQLCQMDNVDVGTSSSPRLSVLTSRDTPASLHMLATHHI